MQLRQGRYDLLEEWLGRMDEQALANLRAGLSVLREIAMNAQPKPLGILQKNEKEFHVDEQ